MIVETDNGPVRAVIAHEALRILSGRSGATATEIALIYEAELADVVRRKVGRRSAGSVRIEPTDL